MGVDKETERLIHCGTCGGLFYGIPEPNMEGDCGNCPACEEWIGEKTEDMLSDIKKKVADNLNSKNRKKFFVNE